MFQKIIDRLTMSKKELADKKRFEAMYDKPFRDFYGVEDKGVSKTREIVYNVLYGGYNKKENYERIEKFIAQKMTDGIAQLGMESLEVMRADMKTTGDYIPDITDKETRALVKEAFANTAKNVLYSDLETNQLLQEAIISAERAAYYDWYGKTNECLKYCAESEGKNFKLFERLADKVRERVSERGLDELKEESVKKENREEKEAGPVKGSLRPVKKTLSHEAVNGMGCEL